jgi:hypothetical protein
VPASCSSIGNPRADDQIPGQMSDATPGLIFKPRRAQVDIAHMLIGAALVLCILTVPLAGGRLGALADLEFRHAWIAVAAVAAQVLVVSLLPGDSYGFPIHNVISVGDVLIVLGAFLVLHRATRSRLSYIPMGPRPPRPAEA